MKSKAQERPKHWSAPACPAQIQLAKPSIKTVTLQLPTAPASDSAEDAGHRAGDRAGGGCFGWLPWMGWQPVLDPYAECRAVMSRTNFENPGMASYVRVVGIERVENEELWQKFKTACRAAGATEALAWHGTSREVAWRIAHEGFRTGKHENIWFAHDSSHSWTFCMEPARYRWSSGDAPLKCEVPPHTAHTWPGSYAMLACRIAWLPGREVWRRGDTRTLTDGCCAYPEYILHLEPIVQPSKDRGDADDVCASRQKADVMRDSAVWLGKLYGPAPRSKAEEVCPEPSALPGVVQA